MTGASLAAPVICIGEILIDLIARPGVTLESADTVMVREGGAPMNAAIAMARLGLPVTFCGAVGNDQFGRRLRARLDVEHVDAMALKVIEGEPTSIAYAWQDEKHDGHFQLLRLADRLLGPDDVANVGIADAGAMLVGSVALAASPSREAILDAVRRAAEANVPVIFDVNVRPTLWPSTFDLSEACEPILRAAKVLKLSLDDAQNLWGTGTPAAAMAAARAYASWLVVITDGSRGVYTAAERDREIRHHKVIAVQPVDPTGAGDAFTAALTCRLVRSGWSRPDDADIRFAMAAGALATTREGAQTALPTLSELERFLAQHPRHLDS